MTKGISMSARFALCMARRAKNVRSRTFRKLAVWNMTNVGCVFLRKRESGEVRLLQA